MLLAGSTMYLRYHYAIDLIAGLGIFVVLCSGWILLLGRRNEG